MFSKVCNSRLKVEELSNSIVIFLISILHISYHNQEMEIGVLSGKPSTITQNG